MLKKILVNALPLSKPASERDFLMLISFSQRNRSVKFLHTHLVTVTTSVRVQGFFALFRVA
jgi:hypothetical protein